MRTPTGLSISKSPAYSCGSASLAARIIAARLTTIRETSGNSSPRRNSTLSRSPRKSPRNPPRPDPTPRSSLAYRSPSKGRGTGKETPLSPKHPTPPGPLCALLSLSRSGTWLCPLWPLLDRLRGFCLVSWGLYRRDALGKLADDYIAAAYFLVARGDHLPQKFVRPPQLGHQLVSIC